MFELLDECLIVEVCPVIDLKFLVERLDLLPELFLGRGVEELLTGVANIWSVKNKYDLRLGSSVRSGILELVNGKSKAIEKAEPYLPLSLGIASLNSSNGASL